MAPTVALLVGGVLLLIGFALGALGFGPQGTGAVILSGVAAALLASTSGDAARRYAPVPVRVWRTGRR